MSDKEDLYHQSRLLYILSDLGIKEALPPAISTQIKYLEYLAAEMLITAQMPSTS